MFSAPEFRTNTFQETFVPDNIDVYASKGRIVVPPGAYSGEENLDPIGKNKADFIQEALHRFEKEADKAEKESAKKS